MSHEPVELLLVEDNPNDVELTLHVLRKYHLANSITVMRDGAEAIDFLFGGDEDPVLEAQKVPKLILLDLKLPKLNGLEVLGKIKAHPRTKSIPVVVLTSSRDDQDLFVSYELGVNSYIVKPVDFSQFTEAVRQLGLYWLVLNERPHLEHEPQQA